MCDKQNVCGSCHFFIQHYIHTEGRFLPINDGHCVGGLRTRRRKALNKKCENWAERKASKNPKSRGSKNHGSTRT